MKILVTGGIGNIGNMVSQHLLERGYSVRIIDYVDQKEFETELDVHNQKAQYRQVDIRDFQALKDSCKGIDVIVHLAAIPLPIFGRESEIFEINAGGTFNVYQAAADLGIKRIISASSINYLGNGFGKHWIDVAYFPIDEDHPGYATDVYAYSKQLVENIAAYFWRRDGISSICLRFPFVYNPSRFSSERKDQYLQSTRDSYARLIALPEDEQRIQAKKLLDLHLKLRGQRNHGEITFTDMWQILNDTPGGLLMFGFADFWTYLHVRDTALSVESAILAQFQGNESFYVAAPENLLGLPTRDLARLFYPKVTTWKHNLQGSQTLLNCDKAKSILGFEASSELL